MHMSDLHKRHVCAKGTCLVHVSPLSPSLYRQKRFILLLLQQSLDHTLTRLKHARRTDLAHIKHIYKRHIEQIT